MQGSHLGAHGALGPVGGVDARFGFAAPTSASPTHMRGGVIGGGSGVSPMHYQRLPAFPTSSLGVGPGAVSGMPATVGAPTYGMPGMTHASMGLPVGAPMGGVVGMPTKTEIGTQASVVTATQMDDSHMIREAGGSGVTSTAAGTAVGVGDDDEDSSYVHVDKQSPTGLESPTKSGEYDLVDDAVKDGDEKDPAELSKTDADGTPSESAPEKKTMDFPKYSEAVLHFLGSPCEVRCTETHAYYDAFIVDVSMRGGVGRALVAYANGWRDTTEVLLRDVRSRYRYEHMHEWTPVIGEKVECQAKADLKEPFGYWKAIVKSVDRSARRGLPAGGDVMYRVSFDGWEDSADQDQIVPLRMLRPVTGASYFWDWNGAHLLSPAPVYRDTVSVPSKYATRMCNSLFTDNVHLIRDKYANNCVHLGYRPPVIRQRSPAPESGSVSGSVGPSGIGSGARRVSRTNGTLVFVALDRNVLLEIRTLCTYLIDIVGRIHAQVAVEERLFARERQYQAELEQLRSSKQVTFVFDRRYTRFMIGSKGENLESIKAEFADGDVIDICIGDAPKGSQLSSAPLTLESLAISTAAVTSKPSTRGASPPGGARRPPMRFTTKESESEEEEDEEDDVGGASEEEFDMNLGQCTIFGTSDKVCKRARDLLDLAELSIEIPARVVPEFVGKGGANIRKIEEKTRVIHIQSVERHKSTLDQTRSASSPRRKRVKSRRGGSDSDEDEDEDMVTFVIFGPRIRVQIAAQIIKVEVDTCLARRALLRRTIELDRELMQTTRFTEDGGTVRTFYYDNDGGHSYGGGGDGRRDGGRDGGRRDRRPSGQSPYDSGSKRSSRGKDRYSDPADPPVLKGRRMRHDDADPSAARTEE